MTYIYSGGNWFVSPAGGTDVFKGKYFAAFLKSMISEDRVYGFLHYGYYDESEWRIICDAEIKHLLPKNTVTDSDDVKNAGMEKEIEAAAHKNRKPGYLLPIKSEWLAVIIYPSLELKAHAQSDSDFCGKLSLE